MEKRKLWAVLCGLLAAAFVGVLFVGNGKLGSLQGKSDEYQAKIAELTGKLNEAKEKADYVPPVTLSEKEQAEVTGSAKELGDKVAELQNAYAGLDPAGDGFTKNVEALDACFAEGSKNARVPWYSGSIKGVWTFITDGTFKGEDKQVLWLCQNPDSGDLVAYATAVFYRESGLFDDVSYEMSLLGNGSVGSSGDQSLTGAIDTDAVQDMADAIKGADVPDERELTNDENADVKESQQKLREQMMKKGGN